MRIRITAGRIVQMISISCESIMYLFVSFVVTMATIV